MTTTLHSFDTAIDLADNGIGHYTGQTTPEWANMVGPFGGVTAAAIIRAIERHPDRIGEPVALTVNYLTPVNDGSFAVTVRAARTNRTNQHWTAELAQDHGLTTTATAIFGVRRDAWSDAEARMPDSAGSRKYDARNASRTCSVDAELRHALRGRWGADGACRKRVVDHNAMGAAASGQGA